MKRWLCIVVVCLLLFSGCDSSRPASAETPLEAALQTVKALENGKEKVRLRASGLDGDEIYAAIESIWPYAFTMEMTEYRGGITEIRVDVVNRARQEQAVTLAGGMARQTVKGIRDDREKLKALHDALIRSCVYDTDTAQQEGVIDGASAPFTAYGALVDGKAVCAGYARAYMLLCQAAGLKTIYIADTQMNHGWNAVALDGETYFIDCTFDDPVPDRGEYVSEEYFFLTAEELRKTHRWNEAFYQEILSKIA